jgi:hypothetical protein
MCAPTPPQPVWQVSVAERSARVELWEHPDGWECRVFSHDRLCRSAVFADVRRAHLEATNWLALLTADEFGGPSGAVQ